MNNTVLRSLTGSLFVALVVFSALYGTPYLIMFFALVLVFGTHEVIRLLEDRGGIYSLWVWVSNLVLFSLVSLHELYEFRSELLWLGALPIVVLFCFQLFQTPSERNSFALQNSLLAIAYITIPLVLSIVLSSSNPLLVLAIFIMLWSNDTMAFLIGKWLGKNKLFERLSPKKTIEGFVGGLLGSLVSSVILSMYHHEINLVFWMVLSIVVSVAGTLGDLFESMLKRNAGVKDSGNVIPGHGGVLDRLDSFLFAAPFVFFCTVLFHAIGVLHSV